MKLLERWMSRNHAEEEHEHHHHDDHDCCHGDGCGCGHDHGEKGKEELLRLGIAFVLFLLALFLKENVLLYYAFSVAALLLAGFETFRESYEHIRKGKVFDECFLMSVATLGALCIGEAAEGAAVMIFYGVGEYVQHLAVSRSTRAVESLLSLCPDTAHKETESGWEDVEAASLLEDDVIRILPGERIPTDGVVLSGHAAVDASSVTGESLPVAAGEGTELFSGSIVTDGELRLRVTSAQKESYAAKMMAMVKEAKETKAPTENFIHRFAEYYTPIVVFAALFLAVVPPLFFGDWTAWIHRGLLFLVASCPCALVLSVPLGFFAGLGNASKHGIFLKGTTHIETLAKCDHIAFDKTGTLTEGTLSVDEIHPVEGLSEEVFLTILSSLEKLSAHPIAKAIQSLGATTVAIEEFQEVAGSGVCGNYKEHSFLAGNGAFLADAGITVPAVGSTALYLGVNGHYAGYVTFRDTLRADSKDSVARLKEMGMDCVILSGDTPKSVAPVAKELDVRFEAGLLPHEKLEKVESMEGVTAFVGDGINDSPALAAANLGIAMGAGGRDAAIETADVVLTQNSIHPVADAILIAKATMRTVWINIGFALAVKLLVMILGVVGIASMAWAVFADVGVCLIAVLHSLYLVFRKTTK